nr:hypothetical protein Iba_chr13cCG10070 [Ipomoea batatas]GME18548.1 hypothetical protein Iba_scaffold20816CG0010 [Ipomoea batatas]
MFTKLKLNPANIHPSIHLDLIIHFPSSHGFGLSPSDLISIEASFKSFNGASLFHLSISFLSFNLPGSTLADQQPVAATDDLLSLARVRLLK